jgi:hypothetical protein
MITRSTNDALELHINPSSTGLNDPPKSFVVTADAAFLAMTFEDFGAMQRLPFHAAFREANYRATVVTVGLRAAVP